MRLWMIQALLLVAIVVVGRCLPREQRMPPIYASSPTGGL